MKNYQTNTAKFPIVKIAIEPKPYSNPAYGIEYGFIILPAGEIVEQISTHVAIREGDKIGIYTKGFETGGDVRNPLDELYILFPEKLYTIPAEDEYNLFTIFERYKEDNRCNW